LACRPAVAAASSVVGQQLLDRVEAGLDPGGTPTLHRRFVSAEVTTQRLQHPAVIQRVDVAADDGGERAHACSAIGIRGQQRWCRMRFLEPLDYRRRLD
jgi:hypothetical protein